MRITESIDLAAADGQFLRGKLSFEPGPAPALLFAHGLGSTREGEKARALEAECAWRGWAFAAFDFRGHGVSDGTMLELRGAQLLEDLEAITELVARRGYETIFLVGSSMGGWAVAWFAALYPQRVRACAFLAPAFRWLEWHRLTTEERQRWQQTGRLRVTNQWIDLELGSGLEAEVAQYPFERLVAQFHTPSLICHGLSDDTVPSAHSLEFMERCQATDVQLLLLKDGDHRLNTHKDWLAQMTCDFLQPRYSGG